MNTLAKMRKINETDEKRLIKSYIRFKGGFCYSNLQGIGSYRGTPDITAVINGKVIQIEVKTERGRQSRWQGEFQHEWEMHGGTYLIGNFDQIKPELDKIT